MRTIRRQLSMLLVLAAAVPLAPSALAARVGNTGFGFNARR
jgi:hypothetical protein